VVIDDRSEYEGNSSNAGVSVGNVIEDYSSGSEEEHHSPVYNANMLGGLEILHE
jgi:hypothetical protein